MTQPLSRRRFVFTILSVGAALGGGLLVRYLAADRTERLVLLEIEKLFPSTDHASALGEAVVRELDIADRGAVHYLREALPNWRHIDLGTPAAVMLALQESVREDFKRENTLQVKKWLISRTEAYLLAAMTARDSTTQ